MTGIDGEMKQMTDEVAAVLPGRVVKRASVESNLTSTSRQLEA